MNQFKLTDSRLWQRKSLALGLTFLLGVFFILVPMQTHAQSDQGVKVLDSKARAKLALRITAGTGIHVEEYNKDTDTFVVRIEGEEAVGPNYTTLQWLLKGIDNGMSEKDLQKNPKKLLGTYYRLKHELWLVSDEQFAARKKAYAERKAQGN